MPSIFVDSASSEFYNTYKLYREYIGFDDSYSYKKWLKLPDKYKAAALYCQFYNEITLAWHKVKTSWSIEEEGIECINQYLLKNVEKIKKDKKRYTPQYIYTVAYNCFYCLCIDNSKNKERYNNETCEEFSANNDDVSWFDFIGEYNDFEDVREKEELINFINSLDEDLQIYIDYILGNITDCQVCRKLKKLGLISGNTKDSSYRKFVMNEFEKYAPAKIKNCIIIKFEQQI